MDLSSLLFSSNEDPGEGWSDQGHKRSQGLTCRPVFACELELLFTDPRFPGLQKGDYSIYLP